MDATRHFLHSVWFRKESVVRYEPRGHGGIAISGGDQHLDAGMMLMDPACEHEPVHGAGHPHISKDDVHGSPEVRTASASVAFAASTTT